MEELLNSMRKSLPKYNVKQPSTGKIVSFRPFTVKEEKSLVIANQTGSYEDFLSTLADIIDSCFDLTVKAKTLPLVDVEYFFLKMRSKSVGELIEPTITCPATQEKIKISINLDEIEPIIDKSHSRKIKINNNIIVTMTYPTLEHLMDKKDKIDYFDLIIDCIQSIQTQKELIELGIASRENIKEFVELLTSEQYRKLIDFFKTAPKLEHEINYKTSDNKERKIILKGLRDFFQ